MTLLRPAVPLSGVWAQETRLLGRQNRYPGFTFSPRPPRPGLFAVCDTPATIMEMTDCDSPVKAWLGTIQPFSPNATDDEVRRIIADLKADRAVGLQRDGTLAHLAGCSAQHELPATVIPGRRLTEAYVIELACRTPPGLPFVRAIEPRICPEASIPDGEDGDRSIVNEPFRPPHLQWREGLLCITFPSDRTWNWGHGVLAEFLDQVSLWLAKHTVWTETRERLGSGNGVWIGGATRHDDMSVFGRLDELSPDSPCHCSSPRMYANCCRSGELNEARRLLLSMVLSQRFRQLRSSLNRFEPQYRHLVLRALGADKLTNPPLCCRLRGLHNIHKWSFATRAPDGDSLRPPFSEQRY